MESWSIFKKWDRDIDEEKIEEVNQFLKSIGASYSIKLVKKEKVETLKECPFCSSIFVSVNFKPDKRNLYRVECGSCGAAGSLEETPEFAIEGWNLALRNED